MDALTDRIVGIPSVLDTDSTARSSRRPTAGTLALLPGAVALLVSSVEVRGTWQFVTVNGEATVTSAPQW